MTDLSSDIVAALRADLLWDGNEDWVAYYAQLPIILAHRLDQPVTIQEVVSCRYFWIKLLLDQDAPTALYAFLEDPDIQDLKSLFGDPAGRMRNRLEDDLSALFPFAQGETVFRTKRSERETLIEYGLTGSALHQYDRGTLTIGDLIRLRPTVVAPRY